MDNIVIGFRAEGIDTVQRGFDTSAAAASRMASVVEQMSVKQAPLPSFAPSHAATLSFVELWAGARQRLTDRAGACARPEAGAHAA